MTRILSRYRRVPWHERTMPALWAYNVLCAVITSVIVVAVVTVVVAMGPNG
jgi:hypothetical protein